MTGKTGNFGPGVVISRMSLSDVETFENRATFFSRLRPILAPSVVLDIELAYTLAKFGHRAQFRKEPGTDGSPLRYFEHVRRVALILIDVARITDPTMITAALLHDSVEDTKDIRPELIEHCFGTDVVSLVLLLSKVPKEGYLDRLEACSDWRPYAIKACDRLDNLRSLFKPGNSESFQQKQLSETEFKYFPLFDRMLTLVPDERTRSKLQIIRDKIRREVYSGLAILDEKPSTPKSVEVKFEEEVRSQVPCHDCGSPVWVPIGTTTKVRCPAHEAKAQHAGQDQEAP